MRKVQDYAPLEDEILFRVRQIATARPPYDFGRAFAVDVGRHRCVVLVQVISASFMAYDMKTGALVGGSRQLYKDPRPVSDMELARLMLREARDASRAEDVHTGYAFGGALNTHFRQDQFEAPLPRVRRPTDKAMDAALPGWEALLEIAGLLDEEVANLPIPDATTSAGYAWLSGQDAGRERRLALFRRYGFAGDELVVGRAAVDRAFARGEEGAAVVLEALAENTPGFAMRGATKGSRKRTLAAIERIAGMDRDDRFDAFEALKAFAASGLPWEREATNAAEAEAMARISSLVKDLKLVEDEGGHLMDVPGGRYRALWDRLKSTELGRIAMRPDRFDMLMPDDERQAQVDFNAPHVMAREVSLPWRRCVEFLLAPLARMEGEPADAPSLAAAARRLMMRDLSLPGLFEAWDEWHAVQSRVDAVLGACARDRGLEWEAPTRRNPLRRGGMEFLWLTTPEQMLDEGASGRDADGMEGLDHCVATYIGDAVKGACHILSVRREGPDGAMERVATAEIEPNREPLGHLEHGMPEFSLVQVQSRRNAEPPPEVAKAVRGIVSDMCAGRLELQDARWTAAEGFRLDPYRIEAVVNDLGSLVKTHEQVEAMLRAFEPTFASGMRGLSLDEFREAALGGMEPDVGPRP